jgi:hypothetical protein
VDKLVGFSHFCVGELGDRRSRHFTFEANFTNFICLSLPFFYQGQDFGSAHQSDCLDVGVTAPSVVIFKRALLLFWFDYRCSHR